MSASGPTFDWRQVDHALANLMLDEVSEEIRKRIEEDVRQIRAENHGNQNALALPLRRLQMQVLHTDEWAQRTYDVYCDVWQRQGNPLTPEFLRAVCANGIDTLIAARTNAVLGELAFEATRTNLYPAEWLKAVTAEFRREMERISKRWNRRIEIEAKTHEYNSESYSSGKTLNLGGIMEDESPAGFSAVRTESGSTNRMGRQPRLSARHWSPFRQWFEAIRKIKQLRVGPHERIPEALVRSFLADQKGIKPEEVTWEQIKCEVSGLLRDYPAITVVPSSPILERIEQDKTSKRGSDAESESVEKLPDTVSRINQKKRRTKSVDLSRYLDVAGLTEKQYQCASLKWEYGLSISGIASELGRNRKTVDQHIHAAQAKMRSSGQYENVRKRLARVRPGE